MREAKTTVGRGYGYEDWVKCCTEYEVTGNVGKGRSKKTWKECVENDLKRPSLDTSVATDRESWRRLVPVCV